MTTLVTATIAAAGIAHHHLRLHQTGKDIAIVMPLRRHPHLTGESNGATMARLHRLKEGTTGK